MSHFIKYCKGCNKVMEQCRCMACNKEILYGLCDDCKKTIQEEIKIAKNLNKKQYGV